MTSKEIEQSDTKIQDFETKKKKKKVVEESELRITMNPWGIGFMVLFVAVLGYLISSLLTAMPPFEYDPINSEYIISDGLLTILCILALVFLGLGIYFGWIRKTKEEEEEEEKEDTEIGGEDDLLKKSTSKDQITFVYVKSDTNEK